MNTRRLPSVAALLAVGVAMVLSATVLHGCNPSQSDPARYGTVTVYVDSTLDATERGYVLAELPRLAALGPAFVETADRTLAVVAVDGWVSPDCAHAAGQAAVGGGVAMVDFTCAPGATAAEAFIGHEIGHALGMLHVCAAGDPSVGCSPTVHLASVHAPALMSPSPLAENDAPDGVSVGAVAQPFPQREDIAEFNRVHPGGL